MPATDPPDDVPASDSADDTPATGATNYVFGRRSATGTSTAPPSTRLLAFVALQTVAVGLLAGVAYRFAGLLQVAAEIGDAKPIPGPAVVLTTLVLVALVLVALVLYLAVPVAVAWYVATRSDRHWLSGVVGAGVAVLGLPWLGWSLGLLTGGTGLLQGLLVLAGGVALVAAANRLAAERAPAGAPAGPPAAVFLGLLVVVVVGAGIALVPFAVWEPTSGLADWHHSGTRIGLAAPSVAFDYDYRPTGDGRGVLTVTHDGGDDVDAEQLSIRGSGFADVGGVDQTEPGPWQGGVTGTTDDGEPAIVADDSVTVGVRGDCEIRLVYETDWGEVQTVGLYECGDGADDDPAPEPTGVPGGR